MTDDLVKRLRAIGGLRHDGATRWYVNPDGPEAADRIEALEAALREIIADCEADYPPSHGAIKYAARAALAGEKKDER